MWDLLVMHYISDIWLRTWITVASLFPMYTFFYQTILINMSLHAALFTFYITSANFLSCFNTLKFHTTTSSCKQNCPRFRQYGTCPSFLDDSLFQQYPLISNTKRMLQSSFLHYLWWWKFLFLSSILILTASSAAAYFKTPLTCWQSRERSILVD